MTTPAQPVPQTPQQPPSADAALVIAIGTALATALTVSAAAALIPSALLRPAAMYRDDLLQSLTIVMAMPPERLGVSGAATMQTSRQNLMRRAQYTVNAARRIGQARKDAISHGTPVMEAVTRAILAERRYYGMHLQANWNRMGAAAKVDQQGSVLVGWNTVHDTRTSAECKAADGANFRADAMPLIGWPGAVHPHCRCYPGPARPGARMLPSASALRRAA
jgi:hypothetical protein